MSKADKKQRQKKKREAKKKEQRRREAVSPFKRLADAPGEVEYWTSGDFGDTGQSEILVFKEAAGLSGVVAFQIDRGVVGLKDAWPRMGLSIGQFRQTVEESRDRGVPLTRTTAPNAAALIAGAIRWTRQNGMRLPKDWEKTVRILGPMPDIATADVSKFVMEFDGHPEDLRQRLIGEPFEAFIKRKDVAILFSNDAPYKGAALNRLDVPENLYDEGDDDADDDDEDDTAEIGAKQLEQALELIAPAARTAAAQTAIWVASKGAIPSIQLLAAWQSLLVAQVLANASLPNAAAEQVARLSGRLLEGVSDRISDKDFPEYENALIQANEHTTADPGVFDRHIRNLIPVKT